MLLVDRLPAGFEIDNPKLVDSDAVRGARLARDARSSRPTPSSATTASSRPSTATPTSRRSSPSPIWCARSRPGRYVHPPATVEDMYRPERFGRTAFGTVEVTCTADGRERRARATCAIAKAPSGARSVAAVPSHLGMARRLRRWRVCDRAASVGGACAAAGASPDAASARSTSPSADEALDRRARSRRAAAAALHHGRTGAGGCRSTTADVDPRFLAMLMAYEDRASTRHHGVDPLALLRAGGQLARARPHRLRRLDPDHAGRAPARAARGAHARRQAPPDRARACSSSGGCRKAEILDLYLTLAPYGGNLEGVRAASLAYFGKEPKRLTFAEAALLVALPQSPETRRPDRFAEAARAARDRVLDRAVARGVLDAAEAAGGEGRAGAGGARGRSRCSPPTRPRRRSRQRPDANVHRLTIDAPAAGEPRDAGARARRAARAAALGRHPGRRQRDAARSAPMSAAPDYLARERAGAIDMTRGAALARLGAEAVHLRARLRERPRPSRDPARRPARRASAPMRRRISTSPSRARSRRAGRCSCRSTSRRSSLLAEVGPGALHRPAAAGAGPTIALPKEAAPGLAVGLGGLGITLADLTRLYAGLARGGDAPALRAARSTARRRCRDGGAHRRSGRGLVRRRHPARRAAARQRARRPHRLQDRHVLRLPRRLGGRLRPAHDDRRLGRPAGRRARCRASSAASSPRRSCSTPSPGSAASRSRSPQPPHALVATDRDAAAAAAAPAPGRAEDHRRDGAARRSRSPSRSTARASISALPATASAAPLALEGGGRRAAPDLARQRRAGRRRRMLRRQSAWRPDGAGFARVSVIDAQGRDRQRRGADRIDRLEGIFRRSGPGSPSTMRHIKAESQFHVRGNGSRPAGSAIGPAPERCARWDAAGVALRPGSRWSRCG